MTSVLLTGANGRMARELRPALAKEFDTVRLYSRREIDTDSVNEEVFLGNLEDLDALESAAEGASVIVHMGGKADESDFSEILSSNIAGTHNVFEAARRAGVKRVVYASSHHVTGFHSSDEMVGPNSDVRPDTYYGVSKVFGEAMGRLYHDKWGLEVVCLRIGVCREMPENSDQLRTWLSIPDSIRLVSAAVTNRLRDGFVVVYGVSNNSARFWDTTTSEQIGFEAQDSADNFRDEFGGDQSFSSAWQGGAFTGVEYRGGTW